MAFHVLVSKAEIDRVNFDIATIGIVFALIVEVYFKYFNNKYNSNIQHYRLIYMKRQVVILVSVLFLGAVFSVAYVCNIRASQYDRAHENLGLFEKGALELIGHTTQYVAETSFEGITENLSRASKPVKVIGKLGFLGSIVAAFDFLIDGTDSPTSRRMEDARRMAVIE